MPTKKKPQKSKSAKKKPKGRPSKYNATWAPLMAKRFATLGMNERDIAKEMGIAESTLNKWKKDHPEFAKELKKGKEEPIHIVENSLYKNAQGYYVEEKKEVFDGDGNLKYYEVYTKWMRPDNGSMAFYLTNKDGENWKRLKQVDVHNTYDDTLVHLADALNNIGKDD